MRWTTLGIKHSLMLEEERVQMGVGFGDEEGWGLGRLFPSL